MLFQTLEWSISGDISANNMRKTGLNSLYDFSVDNRALDISDTTNIQKYLIKKYDIK